MRTASLLAALSTAFALAACDRAPPADAAPATPPPPAAPATVDPPDEAVATGSLAAREAAGEPDATLDFDCEGVRITVAYENDERVARFVVDGDTLSLEREEAASGAMYADAQGNRFWAHRPDEARLTLAGDHERNCYRVY